MKKTTVLALIFAITSLTVSAQKYMVVDSEKVFKSMPAYNGALEEMEVLSTMYQKEVDEAFASVESLYNDYQEARSALTDYARQQVEEVILEREKTATDLQEKLFSPDGELMKKRIEKIKPLQEKVFGVIAQYAAKNGVELVLDITANPSVLYYAPAADKTEEIIQLVK